MKFLIDAHLPPSIAQMLNDAGHDSVHSSSLPGGNATTDKQLNEISIKEERVVMTKDVDFFNSLVLHGQPWKLVLIRTGNIGARSLLVLLKNRLPDIVEALETNTLVEIDRDELHSAP